MLFIFWDLVFSIEFVYYIGEYRFTCFNRRDAVQNLTFLYERANSAIEAENSPPPAPAPVNPEDVGQPGNDGNQSDSSSSSRRLEAAPRESSEFRDPETYEPNFDVHHINYYRLDADPAYLLQRIKDLPISDILKYKHLLHYIFKCLPNWECSNNFEPYLRELIVKYWMESRGRRFENICIDLHKPEPEVRSIILNNWLNSLLDIQAQEDLSEDKIAQVQKNIDYVEKVINYRVNGNA